MSGGGNVDSGGWTNLRFPNAFAHPFEFQGRDGKVRKRMLVTIPKGVVLADGRDLGGWSLSVHASPWALAQKQAGRPVSIGLRVGRSVELCSRGVAPGGACSDWMVRRICVSRWMSTATG